MVDLLCVRGVASLVQIRSLQSRQMSKKRRRKGARFTAKKSAWPVLEFDQICHVWGCLGGCGKWHLWLPFTRSLATKH